MLARGGSTGSQQDVARILLSAQFPCSAPSCPGARASHCPLSWSKKRCCGCARVDAVALSSLLLRATRSLISIPSAFEPFQLPHPCNFSTQLLHPCSFSTPPASPVDSPSLQLLHPSRFPTPADSPSLQLLHPSSFPTSAVSLPNLPISAVPTPLPQHPLQLLFHPSLLWAFILCCLCAQIRSLQAILYHPLSKPCLSVQRKNKPIFVKPLAVCPSNPDSVQQEPGLSGGLCSGK